MQKLGCVITIAAAAGAASAQGTLTFYWDANDTGSNTVTIGPGESLLLRLWVLMEPSGTGFAESGYDILGVENWDTGTITRYENLLGDDDGDLQPNNDILGVVSSQPAPFFNPDFNAENPLALFEIEWTPDDYTARTVRLTETNHTGNIVYTDDFGSTAQYAAVQSEGVTVNIVPAPGALALAPVVVLAASRRRR